MQKGEDIFFRCNIAKYRILSNLFVLVNCYYS
jgi:hypothetical protein